MTNQRSSVHAYQCSYAPPLSVWEQSADGSWYSRPWKRGEKLKYAQEVLGQVEPTK